MTAGSTGRRLRIFAIRLWRLAVLCLIGWLLAGHQARLRIDGDRRITVAEVQTILPEAETLSAPLTGDETLLVQDKAGTVIGEALRSSPHSDDIVGYIGPADVLLVLTPERKVAGIRMRHSWDTPTHVADVVAEKWFWKTWNGRTVAELAALDPTAATVDGVSGATKTSRCVAASITRRAAVLLNQAGAPAGVHWHVADVALAVMMAMALLWTAKRPRFGPRVRIAWQLLVIAVVGLWLGDLLTQSLLLGWAAHGAPWRSSPGLVLLAAGALLVPWTSGRPYYCAHLCPHGALQQLIAAAAPKRIRRPAMSRTWALLPPVLLALLLTIGIFGLDINAAALEPFDAWLWPAAGIGTLIVAAISLVIAIQIPTGYCRYGCPTGALLRFIRSDGPADHLGRRDLAAASLALIAWCLIHWHDPLQAILHGLL